MKKPRLYATMGVIAAALLAVFYVPLPHRVYCTFEIEPRDAYKVYVTVPGEIDQVRVKPGDHVAANTVLAELKNVDVELEVARLEGERDQTKIKKANLEDELVRSRRRQAAGQIEPLERLLHSVEEQLIEKRTDLARLALVTPVAGMVMPPPEMNKPSTDMQLPSWTGTPLEARNQDTFLQEGTFFCQVGDPQKMEAQLVIDQQDVEFIKEQQAVDIKLDELPFETLHGVITEVASEPLKVSPRHLSNKAGGELATKTDETGVERPQNTSYHARVPLDDPEGLLRIGYKGRARIHTAPQPLARRLWRLFTQTFNMRL